MRIPKWQKYAVLKSILAQLSVHQKPWNSVHHTHHKAPWHFDSPSLQHNPISMSVAPLLRPHLRGTGVFSTTACSINPRSPFCLTCFPPYFLCLVICLFQFDRDLNKLRHHCTELVTRIKDESVENRAENIVFHPMILQFSFLLLLFIISVFKITRKWAFSRTSGTLRS